jgi:hypothetical protein
MISRDFKAVANCILKPFKLQPEDGFMTAETCSCYILLIKYILCNMAVLDCKFIYFSDGYLLPCE